MGYSLVEVMGKVKIVLKYRRKVMRLISDVARDTSYRVFIKTLNILPLSLCIYRYVPHNDVLVNDRPYIRRWSHNIIILTIVLQLPTAFSTVTCYTCDVFS